MTVLIHLIDFVLYSIEALRLLFVLQEHPPPQTFKPKDPHQDPQLQILDSLLFMDHQILTRDLAGPGLAALLRQLPTVLLTRVFLRVQRWDSRQEVLLM